MSELLPTFQGDSISADTRFACHYCRRIAVSKTHARRISITSYLRANAGGKAPYGAYLVTPFRMASSIAVTPLDTTKVTFSTDPSARTATVTIGDTWRCFKLTKVTPKHLPRQAYLCKGIEPQVHAPTHRTPLSRDHQSQPSAYRRRPPYRPHRRQCHRQCHQWRHHSFISLAKFVRKSQ